MEKMDFDSIMMFATKVGPLLMKSNMIRWKKVTAAILVSSLPSSYFDLSVCWVGSG